MVVLAKLVGIVAAVAGIGFLLKPQTAKDLLGFWEEGARVYILGVIRILVGMILVLAASECMIPWIVIAMGVVAIAAGGFVFIIGLEKSKKMLAEWKEKPKTFYRKISFVPIVWGFLLLWAI